jgi:nitroimidazol reductase NimA-like FMN-containing flavoprotein (pyridoxamine 5'-phosphate oxidase superfamily)
MPVSAVTNRGKKKAPTLPAAVRRYIAAAHVCRIATASPDGEPHVIPVCPVFDGADTLYVDIGPSYRTARQITANPRATVLIDDYFDDWSKLRRVILRCRVRRARGVERDAAWRRIRRKYPQYRAIDWQPRLTLALRIESWRAEGV